MSSIATLTSITRNALATLVLGVALTGAAFAAEKVNINTADAATLDRVLVNVGPAKAEAIVAYRKQHGAFRSMEQLAEVDGIGLKTVEKNRELILVGGVAARPATAPVAKAAPKLAQTAAKKR